MSSVTAVVTVNPWYGHEGFRLTLTNVTPWPTADVTGASTIYDTPAIDDQCWQYYQSAWMYVESAQISATPSLAANTLYYVYRYWTGSALALEFSTTAPTVQQGVQLKTGDSTRRFRGCIYTDASGKMNDSAALRNVANVTNLMSRQAVATYSSGTATGTTSATPAQIGTLQLEVTVAVPQAVDYSLFAPEAGPNNTGGNGGYIAIGTGTSTVLANSRVYCSSTSSYPFIYWPMAATGVESLSIGHVVRYGLMAAAASGQSFILNEQAALTMCMQLSVGVLN